MAQQKGPPGGPPPQQGPPHHHHQPGQPVGTGFQGTVDTEVPPEELKYPLVTDHVPAALPERIAIVGGRPQAATEDKTPPPQTVLSREQEVQAVLDEQKAGYLQDSSRLPGALRQAHDLANLQFQVDPEVVRIGNPYNKDQVRPAAYALLHACQSVQDARAMKVDLPLLGTYLGQLERIRMLRGPIDAEQEILDANESQVLNKLADLIDGALTLGQSVIKGNGALSRMLRPALAIRGAPVEAGLQTKGQNLRVDQAARADERQKMAGEGGAEQKPATTTTVTTETNTPPAVTPAPKTSPGPKGHKPKSGQ